MLLKLLKFDSDRLFTASLLQLIHQQGIKNLMKLHILKLRVMHGSGLSMRL